MGRAIEQTSALFPGFVGGQQVVSSVLWSKYMLRRVTTVYLFR